MGPQRRIDSGLPDTTTLKGLRERNRLFSIFSCGRATMKRYVILASLGLLLLSPAFASASIQYAGNPTDGLYWYPGGGTVGTKFLSSISTSVIRLGVYDYGDNGLINSHEVGIWHATDAVGDLPFVSVTIPAGTIATLLNGYRWEEVTASIVAGQEYVIGAAYPGGLSEVADDWFKIVAPIDSNFTLEEARYTSVSGLSIPNYTVTGISGYFGPNFEIPAETGDGNVPEPATLIVWSMLGLSGAGAWVWRRRNGADSLGAGRAPWSEQSRTAILQIIDRGASRS
jgi:hypothetical protein